jgi:hypothetical protein
MFVITFSSNRCLKQFWSVFVSSAKSESHFKYINKNHLKVLNCWIKDVASAQFDWSCNLLKSKNKFRFHFNHIGVLYMIYKIVSSAMSIST